MPAINLNHVSVVARDLRESLGFYEEIFGMQRVPTPNFGFPVQWLRVGPLQLQITLERPHDLGLEGGAVVLPHSGCSLSPSIDPPPCPNSWVHYSLADHRVTRAPDQEFLLLRC